MPPARDTRRDRPVAVRAVAGGCLLLAAVAAALLLHRGSEYTLHARFVDAGQLVKGGLVQVAGKRVGTIADIRLTDDNQADVVLHIHDSALTPVHRGTIARIRAIGLAGIANRFVDLTPGPSSAPAIADGGVLDAAHTRPIVDLD